MQRSVGCIKGIKINNQCPQVTKQARRSKCQIPKKLRANDSRPHLPHWRLGRPSPASDSYTAKLLACFSKSSLFWLLIFSPLPLSLPSQFSLDLSRCLWLDSPYMYNKTSPIYLYWSCFHFHLSGIKIKARDVWAPSNLPVLLVFLGSWCLSIYLSIALASTPSWASLY